MAAVVDVVVPCYNYARYLRACVASALDQVNGAVRVLIIDDASSDDTQEVAGKLAANDTRVTFQRHPENRGHIRTYNEGLLDWAKSRYSVLLSADDLLAPGSLDRAVGLMDSNPSVGLTYGLATTFTDGESPTAVGANSAKNQIVAGDRFIKRVCERGNAVPTPAAVVRTALQQSLGGYKKELPHSGDMEMWLRFALNGPVGVINAVQAFYRVHAASMSVQYYKNFVRDRREQVLAAQDALAQSKGSVPEFPRWVDAMSKRFALECFWAASHAFDRGDHSTAQECLEQAHGFDPSISNSMTWKKLAFKRWFGPNNWARVQRIVDIARPRPIVQPAQSAGLRTGQQIGWWPSAAES